ncbi:protein kinase domain-containing protein [Arcanobacterium canis]
MGLDETGEFACDRIQHEYRAIDELSSVKGIVNGLATTVLYGHVFMLEEYIDGIPLTSWIAQNYPYSQLSDPDEYLRHATEIIKKIHETVEDCHKLGWAIFDLQPMNILVVDNEIRIIDLEAAVKVGESEARALGTPGFVPSFKCSAFENDWYAFNVVLLNMLVPLVPLNAITEDLETAQINMARSLFGESAEPILDYLHDFPTRSSLDIRCCANDKGTALEDLKVELENGLFSCLSADPLAPKIPGDILQFEPFGRFSINHGLFGVFPYLTNEGQESLVGQVLGSSEEYLQRGYLSGVDGALLILEQAGLLDDIYKEAPLPDLEMGNPADISLRTGLSGLVLIDAVRALTTEKVRRYEVEKRARSLASLVDTRAFIISRQATSTTQAVGLLDGLLGAALALFTVAEVLENEGLKNSARTAIDIELHRLVKAPDGSIQVLDNNRLMPYMAEGSSGFLIAASLCPPIAELVFQSFTPEEFCAATDVRTVANGGLHLGLTGLALARHLAYKKGWVRLDLNLVGFHEQLAMHTFSPRGGQELRGAFLGGQGGLRLSADFSTGNAGVIRAIEVLSGRCNQWSVFPGLEPLADLW